ncbi:hypothetical protein [Micromonospora sp. NBC_01813]|uniref:hypothetical protein n=1 Tax=Micromonospora sp. NBC_01813 TaxID=2975988 RepID=UPI002DDBB216|nr:hypothetical protein [Micromonospora sp. NBC_01813]WSA07056.1 hypothetical protein OG958_22710 [Micromonospora sp. NBC_01813]
MQRIPDVVPDRCRGVDATSMHEARHVDSRQVGAGRVRLHEEPIAAVVIDSEIRGREAMATGVSCRFANP